MVYYYACTRLPPLPFLCCLVPAIHSHCVCLFCCCLPLPAAGCCCHLLHFSGSVEEVGRGTFIASYGQTWHSSLHLHTSSLSQHCLHTALRLLIYSCYSSVLLLMYISSLRLLFLLKFWKTLCGLRHRGSTGGGLKKTAHGWWLAWLAHGRGHACHTTTMPWTQA